MSSVQKSQSLETCNEDPTFGHHDTIHSSVSIKQETLFDIETACDKKIDTDQQKQINIKACEGANSSDDIWSSPTFEVFVKHENGEIEATDNDAHPRGVYRGWHPVKIEPSYIGECDSSNQYKGPRSGDIAYAEKSSTLEISDDNSTFDCRTTDMSDVIIKQDILNETEIKEDPICESTQRHQLKVDAYQDASCAGDLSSEDFVKRESYEIELTETVLQPPDIYYDRLRAKMASSDNMCADLTSSGGMRALSEAHEETHPRVDHLHQFSSYRDTTVAAPQKTKGYQCDICKRIFKQKFSLSCHIIVHTGEKPFKCSTCSFNTAYKHYMVHHTKIHSEDKPYHCDLCEYKAAHKTSLIRHKINHIGEKPHHCDLCDYKAARRHSLKSHMRIHTGGEKTYRCDMCDYKAAHEYLLKKHNKVHTGEKPYLCDVCDYKTAHRYLLKRHVIMHTGERPYPCDLCAYKGSRKHLLKSHMRIHTDEKRYHCDVCSYESAHKNALRIHMRIHSGEKPYHL